MNTLATTFQHIKNLVSTDNSDNKSDDLITIFIIFPIQIHFFKYKLN